MNSELREALADARERQERQRTKTRAALARLDDDGSSRLKDRRRTEDQRTDNKFHHKLLGADDLWARGIRFSRQHLYRLIKGGQFPKPIKLGSGDRNGGRNAWLADEINSWIAARISERDATI